MAQEALGRNTGVVTPDKPAVLPLPKTKPQITPQGEGKSHRLRNTVLATTIALTGVEGAGAMVQENINHEPVSGHTLVQDAMWPATLIGNLLGEKVPSVYDSNADKQTIKAGVNTQPITDADLAKIETNITPPPNPLEEHGLPALPEFNLLTPFLLKEKDQIDIFKGYSGPGVDVATGKVVEPLHAGFLRFTVAREGTEVMSGIVDPELKLIEAFKNKPFVVNGREYFGGETLKITRTDGTQYYVSFSSPNDVRALTPLPVLNDAPTILDKDWVKQKGVQITATTLTMATGIPNAPINVYIYRISPTMSINDSAFAAIKMFTSSNNKALYIPAKP